MSAAAAPDPGGEDDHDEPALFVADGDHWRPTGYSRGPWSADSLHGGPVAALVVRAAELVPAPRPARLARVTVELLRPVPLSPLSVRAALVRPGAKVATIDVEVRTVQDDQLVALARAQRIRTSAVEFPDGAVDEVPDLPGAATDLSGGYRAAFPTFHLDAVEHRFSSGGFVEQGPSFDWIRLSVPVVAGETPTGWQRAAAVADFTNGISSVMPFDGRSMFINPDLTVHLWREPQGEWIGSDAVTRSSDTGIGMSETALYDSIGRVGRGVQSLLLDRT